VAFVVASSLMVFIINKTKEWHSAFAYLLAIPIVQIIDSLIFFPIVFTVGLRASFLPLALEGTLIKIAIGLVTVPIFYWLTKKQ
jgi:uncharacterized PurR-regulated membrane protein YhhQ (DUF165 family)